AARVPTASGDIPSSPHSSSLPQPCCSCTHSSTSRATPSSAAPSSCSASPSTIYCKEEQRAHLNSGSESPVHTPSHTPPQACSMRSLQPSRASSSQSTRPYCEKPQARAESPPTAPPSHTLGT